mgnify:CR=1 FL=1
MASVRDRALEMVLQPALVLQHALCGVGFGEGSRTGDVAPNELETASVRDRTLVI